MTFKLKNFDELQRELDRLCGGGELYERRSWVQPSAGSISHRVNESLASLLRTMSKPGVSTFLSGIRVVSKTRAKFAIQYPDGKVVMAPHGGELYFSNASKAKTIQETMQKQYQMDVVVVHGPACTTGSPGKRV